MMRTWSIGVLRIWALVLMSCSPAVSWASEEPSQSNGEMDFLLPRADLTLWTIVVFVVLLWLLRKVAWGPMLEGLRKREQTIQGNLEEAQRARTEAQRLRQQLQAEIDRAHEQVQSIIDQGRRDTQQTTEDMLTRARAEIQTERERLRREIDLARDHALQQLWSQAAQLATMISAKAIRRMLTVEDHRGLVEEAVAELGQTAAKRIA
jgi:F-type H+-transporting ATPase subunit b